MEAMEHVSSFWWRSDTARTIVNQPPHDPFALLVSVNSPLPVLHSSTSLPSHPLYPPINSWMPDFLPSDIFPFSSGAFFLFFSLFLRVRSTCNAGIEHLRLLHCVSHLFKWRAISRWWQCSEMDTPLLYIAVPDVPLISNLYVEMTWTRNTPECVKS